MPKCRKGEIVVNVLVVEPGYEPYEKEIEGLKEMQAAVGGLIQPIYPYEELVALVCNEEGLVNGMEFNRSVEGGYQGVFGPFFVCGLEDNKFCSLTSEQMERYKKKFHKAEILVAVINGKELVTIKVDPQPKIRREPQKPPKTPER